MTTQTLLQRAKEADFRDIEARTLIFVLPRPEEAMAVKHDGGTTVEDEQEGYELKKDQIDLRVNGMNLYNLPVVFFNAREDDTEAASDQIYREDSAVPPPPRESNHRGVEGRGPPHS
jgi:hypothetical protein